MADKDRKKINAKVGNTAQYLQIFNGIFELTDMEREVLAAFIDMHQRAKDAGFDINPFATQMKKKVAEKLGKDNFNSLNHYIKALHDKRAISRVEDGYKVQEVLIPQGESEIVFKLKRPDDSTGEE